MLKQKFAFAVSFVAMLIVGFESARADIASTIYVKEGVASAKAAAADAKLSATNANTAAGAAQVSADKAQAAADKAQESADDAVATKLSTEQGETNPNKIMITNANGTITPVAITTSGNGGLVTGVSVSNGTLTVNKGASLPTGALASKSTITNADVATNAAIAASKISGLATVATSGSYNDLSNKPTIPTVNNATLTIQKNGATVDTFTANASSNKTINITVPTGALASKSTISNADVADNAAIAASKISGLATVATSGSYNDLSNKPTIPSGALASKSTITNTDVAANAAIDQSKISGLSGALATITADIDSQGTQIENLAENVVNNYALKTELPTVNNATLTIKNGATNTNLATFTANATSAATAIIPAASSTTAGLAKWGQIPSGGAEATTYATIWVE